MQYNGPDGNSPCLPLGPGKQGGWQWTAGPPRPVSRLNLGDLVGYNGTAGPPRPVSRLVLGDLVAYNGTADPPRPVSRLVLGDLVQYNGPDVNPHVSPIKMVPSTPVVWVGPPPRPVSRLVLGNKPAINVVLGFFDLFPTRFLGT